MITEAQAKQQLENAKTKLQNAITKMENVSAELKDLSKFKGIGTHDCASALDIMTSELKGVQGKMNFINTSELSDVYKAMHPEKKKKVKSK